MIVRVENGKYQRVPSFSDALEAVQAQPMTTLVATAVFSQETVRFALLGLPTGPLTARVGSRWSSSIGCRASSTSRLQLSGPSGPSSATRCATTGGRR